MATPLQEKAKALRTALEGGEININALRSFLLDVEAEVKPVNPESKESIYQKYAIGMMTKKGNKLRKKPIDK